MVRYSLFLMDANVIVSKETAQHSQVFYLSSPLKMTEIKKEKRICLEEVLGIAIKSLST